MTALATSLRMTCMRLKSSPRCLAAARPARAPETDERRKEHYELRKEVNRQRVRAEDEERPGPTLEPFVLTRQRVHSFGSFTAINDARLKQALPPRRTVKADTLRRRLAGLRSCVARPLPSRLRRRGG